MSDASVTLESRTAAISPTSRFVDLLWPQTLPPFEVFRTSSDQIKIYIPSESARFVCQPSQRMALAYGVATKELLLGSKEALQIEGSRARRRKGGSLTFSKTYDPLFVAALFPVPDQLHLVLSHGRVVIYKEQRLVAFPMKDNSDVSDYCQSRWSALNAPPKSKATAKASRQVFVSEQLPLETDRSEIYFLG